MILRLSFSLFFLSKQPCVPFVVAGCWTAINGRIFPSACASLNTSSVENYLFFLPARSVGVEADRIPLCPYSLYLSLDLPLVSSVGASSPPFLKQQFCRETQVIHPLVTQLGNKNTEAATEVAIALGKFTCPENFLRMERSKAIIEFDGVPPLLRLVKANEWAQFHGLTLLCYLALHVGNNEALELAKALIVLEAVVRSVATQNPSLKELISKAIYPLEVYQTGIHTHRHS